MASEYNDRPSGLRAKTSLGHSRNNNFFSGSRFGGAVDQALIMYALVSLFRSIHCVTDRKKLSTGLLLSCLVFFSCPVFANPDTFSACLARLQQEARLQGLSQQSIAVLGEVNPLPRTIELDRNQPEFVQTFAGYFNKRVSDYRINRGREMLAQHADFLNALTQQYGVPAQYLIAFWAMESNFGRHIGKMPILDSLATLACDERRSELFTRELFSALRLMEKHQIDVADMQGSWAGAIGHTQFLPSAYMRFGVDGDNDNRVDLWRSQADALTSAAYYLQQLGWQPELRWGREVLLPETFPYHLSGIENSQPLEAWRELGVLTTTGKQLPNLDITASLLIPSGADGPKFLVYENFHVIMKWNRSQYYALSVGHLADRINGAGTLQQPPPNSQPLTREQITQLQTALKERGFDPGTIDGQLGPQTSSAIRAYQKARGLLADGFADYELYTTLQ